MLFYVLFGQWRQRLVNIGGMNSSFLSLPLPLSPSFSPFPSLPGEPQPPKTASGSGGALKLPSGSGRSPATRRFLVYFRLKRTLLVITIIKEVSYQSTAELSRQRLFDWQYFHMGTKFGAKMSIDAQIIAKHRNSRWRPIADRIGLKCQFTPQVFLGVWTPKNN